MPLPTLRTQKILVKKDLDRNDRNLIKAANTPQLLCRSYKSVSEISVAYTQQISSNFSVENVFDVCYELMNAIQMPLKPSVSESFDI